VCPSHILSFGYENVAARLGIWFSGGVLAWYVQSPELPPQHHKREKENTVTKFNTCVKIENVAQMGPVALFIYTADIKPQFAVVILRPVSPCSLSWPGTLNLPASTS
jgi:hypothetical protein